MKQGIKSIQNLYGELERQRITYNKLRKFNSKR